MLLWLVACGGGGGGGTGGDPCALPPSGDGFVLFTDDRAGNYEIRAIKLDGTCDQLVGSSPLDDLAPTWSRGAGLAAWTGGLGGGAGVVLKDLQTGAGRLLDTGDGVATAPALSPDGTLVAFERTPAGGATSDVFVVPVAGGAPVLVAEGFKPAGAPASDAGPFISVSPAGRYVYFTSDRAHTSAVDSPATNEVWRVAIAADGTPSGAPERLTTASGLVGRPSVSADGLSFVYARAVSASSVVVVSHVIASAAERQVTTQQDSEPTLSAGGDRLVVKTSRFGGADLVVLDAASGALLKRLTSGDHSVGAPAFPR